MLAMEPVREIEKCNNDRPLENEHQKVKKTKDTRGRCVSVASVNDHY